MLRLIQPDDKAATGRKHKKLAMLATLAIYSPGVVPARSRIRVLHFGPFPVTVIDL